MTITPVSSLEERKKRCLEMASFSSPSAISPFATQKFYAHLYGLEQFAGKRVLEIGGTDEFNVADFFLGMDAQYETVRLEQNAQQRLYVHSTNFMDFAVWTPYDLVLSLGVFERAAIDRDTITRQNNVGGSPRFNTRDRLGKLYELTAPGGFNLIGTISDPCMFSNSEIKKSGFELQYRDSPFYSGPLGYHHLDKSELLVLKK